MADEATLGIGAVVPNKLVTNCCVKVHHVRRIHFQIPYNDTVATFSSSQGIGISTGFCKFTTIEIDAAAITNFLVQTGNRCNMLNHFIQCETLFKV